MFSLTETISGLALGSQWLLLSNLALTGAVAVAALRYRRLHGRALDELRNHRDLIENLSEGVYKSTLEGTQFSANRALVTLNGYASEAEMLEALRDTSIAWYVEPGRHDQFREILRREGVIEDFVSEIYRHKTRERIWITESARLVRDPRTGAALYYEGSVRDITEFVNKLRLEEMLRKLSSQVPGGLFQFVRSADGSFHAPYISSGFRGITGVRDGEDDLTPREFLGLLHREDRQWFLRSLRQSARQMELWHVEFRVTARDGVEKWLRISAKPEAIGDGIMWHGYVNDISVRKRNEMEIKKLAFYDSLTGLPNRRLFMERMAKVLAACRTSKAQAALIYIDLDNFKTLNDTRGHDVGDEYLVEVARRLGGCVRAADMVARIGGDEFVIILEAVGYDSGHAARTAIMTANKMLAALREDYTLGRFSHRSSASLGVVIFDGSEQRTEELLKQADIAMYQAKAAGRNGMALYDHLAMSPESERYRLLNDFKNALGTDALELYFQPQMDDMGSVVGAEALCRWHHPELGTLLPERFVPLTEQFGLVREFGNLVMERGIAQLSRWQENEATESLRLSLNVNVQSIACEDFVANLAALLATHGVEGRLLTLELTENVMARDRKQITRRLQEVKQLGVRLSLDDFGSGYSSLAQLKRLPFDELKIDGGFIADIESGESDRSLVKSILGTARTLKLTAVAEHVENARQEAFLRAFGCDYFQGYHYSPALTAADFEAFVVARNDHLAIMAQNKRYGS